ncbi:putative inorganic phosphate cotransporter isoform X1 [Trichogramma pretiosum]|uniref:putative inorganic phosphate cotransporter isoform X1 n=1 Tax=Trichogramma pretiosum TaxID=7493 RepID=UPI0006C9AF44|nr:putative inorganic phosphate cotransporter isoform X1 [Trichogramma pretiosum]
MNGEKDFVKMVKAKIKKPNVTPAPPNSLNNSFNAEAAAAAAATAQEGPAPRPKRWFGIRHLICIMLFSGMANAYIMRTNMSVAIVAMVNHTAIELMDQESSHEEPINECPYNEPDNVTQVARDGPYEWSFTYQGYLLSAFFYGYVLTQIPFGILAKRYGAKTYLAYGMLINSVFGLLVPVSADVGYWALIVVRFIQGLGEGPIVPCTHAMLAKWAPPDERSVLGAIVYAGAQFGTVISMPLSGLLSEHGFAGGWPSIFYVFGTIGTIWCFAFLLLVHEDPEVHPTIPEEEKKYIMSSLYGTHGTQSPPVPWREIFTSMPFWSIMVAHMGHNYGYETLMTELPTYMKQVLKFDIKHNGAISALPYLAMWIFSVLIAYVADWMIQRKIFGITATRKIVNSIGQFGPAVCLTAASYTGCNPTLTIVLLTLGVGLNGGIYSGFKVNHLDISPRYAGVLMSFTNCTANMAGLLAPITAGYLISGTPSQAKWRSVFLVSACIYVICGTFYICFGSGVRQPWDDPENDANVMDRIKKQEEQQEREDLAKKVQKTEKKRIRQEAKEAKIARNEARKERRQSASKVIPVTIESLEISDTSPKMMTTSFHVIDETRPSS